MRLNALMLLCATAGPMFPGSLKCFDYSIECTNPCGDAHPL